MTNYPNAARENFFAALTALPQERVAVICSKHGELKESAAKDKHAVMIPVRLAFMHQKLWEKSQELSWNERRKINRRLTGVLKIVAKAQTKAEEKFTHPRFVRDDKAVAKAVGKACIKHYSSLLNELDPELYAPRLGSDVEVIHAPPLARIGNGERGVCFIIAVKDNVSLGTFCCAKPVKASINGFLCLGCNGQAPWELAQPLKQGATLEEALTFVAGYMGIDPMLQAMLQVEIANTWQAEFVDKVLDQILEDLKEGALHD